jgi:hypothetical protein
LSVEGADRRRAFDNAKTKFAANLLSSRPGFGSEKLLTTASSVAAGIPIEASSTASWQLNSSEWLTVNLAAGRFEPVQTRVALSGVSIITHSNEGVDVMRF